MTKCACPPCNNPVSNRLQAKLDRIQQQMLGYFCTRCIIRKCDHQHKAKS